MASSNPAIVSGVFGQDDDPSKVFSGSDPDSKHLTSGGYHPSVDQLRAHRLLPDYAFQLPLDTTGYDSTRSAGLDTSRSKANMILRTTRMFAAMRGKDPRVRAVRECNGTLDGVTTANYDAALGRQNYKPDSTHLWHNHYGFLRFYMTDQTRAWAEVSGIVSVLNGQSLQQYLAGNPTSNLGGESVNPVDQEDHAMQFPFKGGKGSQYPDAVFVVANRVVTWVPGSTNDDIWKGVLDSIGRVNGLETNGRVTQPLNYQTAKPIASFDDLPVVDQIAALGVLVGPTPG